MIAIMQPYFFPYLGYFQLVDTAKKFVFFDDVNFIKKGFIHRNSLVVNGQLWQFSVPLNKPSQNSKINEIALSSAFDSWKSKFLKTIAATYGKSPHYWEVLSIIDQALSGDSMATLAFKSVQLTSDYLGLDTEFLRSSSIAYDRLGNGQSKIISICQQLGEKEYVNMAGGRSLYQPEAFDEAGLSLNFLETNSEQLQNEIAHPFASIIHLLFNFPPDKIKDWLTHKTINNAEA